MNEEHQKHQEHHADREAPDELRERPWIVLDGTHDVEAWIDAYNRELQQVLAKNTAQTAGYGICFCLGAGGDIYMHTNGDGDILLDVTPDATWVSPAITAATGVAPPRSQIWALPGETLTQLLMGLSSLIGSTRIVLKHEYRIRKY